MKRGLTISVLFLIILSFGLVVAPSHPFLVEDGVGVDIDNFNDIPSESGSGFGDGGEFGVVKEFDFDEDDEEEIEDSFDDKYDEEKLYEEAEKFDEVFDVDAGSVPGDFFYFLDGIIDSREEKVAEMKILAERCKDGDQKACDALEGVLEKYKKHADEYAREVSPEQREEARRTSRAIRGVMIREIAKNAPPTLKDELVREVVKREKSIESAAEIASEIDKLCDRLINEFGAYEKARDVCSLNFDEDDEDDFHRIPEWKKKKIEEWKKTISEDAKKFIEVLSDCAEDNECDCNEMPGKEQVDICFKIIEAEGSGEDSGELIREFRDSLPEDLREAFDRFMREFEEEDFDRHGPPPECRGIDDFRECMVVMARDKIDQAPEPCRKLIRGGLRDGSIRGREDSEELCSRILYDLRRPSECDDIDNPRDCARLFEGRFGSRGPGPGIEIVNCEDNERFPFIEQKLECYRHNAERVDLSGDYYSERDRYRGDEFYNYEDFDRRFREEHRDDYVGFAQNEYLYEYHDDRDFYSSRADHQAKIDAFFASEEYRKGSAEGRPWFCDGPPEKPCYMGEAYDYSGGDSSYDYGGNEYYRDYEDYGEKTYFSPGEPIFDCALLDCLPGDYCDPYKGCVQEFSKESYPDEPSGETCPVPAIFCDPATQREVFDPITGCFVDCELIQTTEITPEEKCNKEGGSWDGSSCIFPEPTTTGYTITGNAFLDYYFR